METEKDKWISKIVASASEIKRLHAPDDLYEKLIDKIDNPVNRRIAFSPYRMAIAAIFVLVTLNVGVILFTYKLKEKPEPANYGLSSYNLKIY
jgi:hypothetical protein